VRERRSIARSLERRVARHDPCRKSAVVQPEDEIRDIVDRESHAWDTQDVELLLSVFHPDMVWVWPRTDTSTDPIDWVVKMGRFNALAPRLSGAVRQIRVWLTIAERS
jgi:ketosteroid isomerase-like protein